MRRGLTATLLAGVALATTGAAPEENDSDAGAVRPRAHGDGLRRLRPRVFAIVWAGFILMAEGGEERGGGRAKTAVVMAVVGLVLVLSAKGVAALLSHGVIPPNPIEKRKRAN